MKEDVKKILKTKGKFSLFTDERYKLTVEVM